MRRMKTMECEPVRVDVRAAPGGWADARLKPNDLTLGGTPSPGWLCLPLSVSLYICVPTRGNPETSLPDDWDLIPPGAPAAPCGGLLAPITPTFGSMMPPCLGDLCPPIAQQRKPTYPCTPLAACSTTPRLCCVQASPAPAPLTTAALISCRPVTLIARDNRIQYVMRCGPPDLPHPAGHP